MGDREFKVQLKKISDANEDGDPVYKTDEAKTNRASKSPEKNQQAK